MVEGPPVKYTEEQILDDDCAENSPKMKYVFMQAAVWFSVCRSHGAGMTVPDKRQKFQEDKENGPNRTTLTPPLSKVVKTHFREHAPRE